MSDSNENPDVRLGTGVPPISPLGGPSLEEEEKALKKGRGRMIAAMVAAGAAVLGLLVFFMAGDGEVESYRKFGKNINGLDLAHFDQFWACALQGVPTGSLKNDQELRTQINRRAEQGSNRYGAHLRRQCLPKLTEFGPKLEALIPPDDMRPKVTELRQAVGDLRGAVSDYAAYLEGLEDGYDPESESATENISRVARAWYDYRRIISDINKSLRAVINE